MNHIEHEGILHEAYLDEGGLCLRVDTDGLPWQTNNAQPIAIVRLIGCVNGEESLHTLQEEKGKSLYVCSAEAGDGGVTVVLELDYGISELEVRCTGVSQTYSDYTQEDLRRKCRWLSLAYQSSQEECLAAERKQSALSSGLTQAIFNEQERCQQKLEFFRQANPERVAEMRGHLAAYERVLARMAQLTQPDPAAT